MKLYTAAVYNVRMCMGTDNPGWNWKVVGLFRGIGTGRLWGYLGVLELEDCGAI